VNADRPDAVLRTTARSSAGTIFLDPLTAAFDIPLPNRHCAPTPLDDIPAGPVPMAFPLRSGLPSHAVLPDQGTLFPGE
jgi:hypothetical protein